MFLGEEIADHGAHGEQERGRDSEGEQIVSDDECGNAQAERGEKAHGKGNENEPLHVGVCVGDSRRVTRSVTLAVKNRILSRDG